MYRRRVPEIRNDRKSRVPVRIHPVYGRRVTRKKLIKKTLNAARCSAALGYWRRYAVLLSWQYTGIVVCAFAETHIVIVPT